MATKREAKIALTEAWDEYRPEILSSIALNLSERLPQTWVAVTSVLPHGLPTRSYRSLWKKAMEVGLRPTEYVPVEGHYLLRHKFGNAYFLWCMPRSEYSGELDALVDRAMTKTPKGSIPGITQLQDEIDADCAMYIEQLNSARLSVETVGKKTTSSPPRKRKALGDRNEAPVIDHSLAAKKQKCQTSYQEFQKMSDIEKEVIFSMLVSDSNKLDALRHDDETRDEIVSI